MISLWGEKLTCRERQKWAMLSEILTGNWSSASFYIFSLSKLSYIFFPLQCKHILLAKSEFWRGRS